ncbi:hypothetical protein V2J09_008570 [Rumex salicifolius]
MYCSASPLRDSLSPRKSPVRRSLSRDGSPVERARVERSPLSKSVSPRSRRADSRSQTPIKSDADE